MKRVILLLISFQLAACNSDLDIVRDGVMDLNQSLTIGEAFGGWKECFGGEWSELKGERGERVVQYICQSKNANTYLKTTEETVAAQWPSLNQDYLHVTTLFYRFQWMINRDNTFSLSYAGVLCNWKDGLNIEIPYHINIIAKDVYANTVYFHTGEQKIWQGIPSPGFFSSAHTKAKQLN